MPDDLTPMQRSVLLILMAEARELPNTELTTDWKVKLEKPSRDELVKHGLITERREKRRVFLDLTDAGARWCRDQRGTDLPARMGHGGAAAYALLSAIQRFLDRTGTSLPEFVARVDRPEPPAAFELASADLETRIRKAYQELTAGPGEWVKLADLRPALGGSPRAEIDRTLVLMNRTADVTIVPESDQKTLTEPDRAAAVVIGNEDKHLISIGPS